MTTSRTHPSSRRLPGPVLASAGLPWSETAAFVAVVPLLGVPVLLATSAAAWAATTVLLLTVAVAALCLARRVVLGTDWLADRRLWRYRVTHRSELRAVRFVENGHGGLLKISPRVGRAHRLRRPEFDRREVRVALARLLQSGGPEVGPGVRAALGLPAA